MASLTLKVRNYRAIPYRRPLEFEIGKGITFFLGPNNVGKSSLIKMFYELRAAFASVLTNQPKQTVSLTTIADELFNQGSEERAIEIRIIKGSSDLQVRIEQEGDQSQKRYTVSSIRTIGKEGELNEILDDVKGLFVESLFIPSIRPMTLRTHDSKIKDVTVSSSLISEIAQWQTGHSLKRKQEFAELEAGLGELFSTDDFRIEVGGVSGNLQLRIDGKFFGIDDLGDGVAHFIFALANALFRKPAYVLIDEPEIGLHPRLQQTFVRALAAKATRGLIAASHSLGLARSSADRIFTVEKDLSGVTIREFGDNPRYSPRITDSLHELGYSQFVELGGDCILLVEGRTDIKAFREILRKFNAEQKVIIWHLGGSGFLDSGDVTQELSEVKRLNPRKVAVVFDSERTSASAPLAQKFENFKTRAEEIGYSVYATDLHSTENYVSQAALDTVFPTQNFRALGPFEKFDKTKPHWGKSENWKLFREMSREDVEKTGIGAFLIKELLS
jgi:ABC-type cobalamin/Fe3+-siderophores transport system ATPase subunit